MPLANWYPDLDRGYLKLLGRFLWIVFVFLAGAWAWTAKSVVAAYLATPGYQSDEVLWTSGLFGLIAVASFGYSCCLLGREIYRRVDNLIADNDERQEQLRLYRERRSRELHQNLSTSPP